MPAQGNHRYPDIWVKEHKRKFHCHRAMWTVLFGPVPENMCVLHRCDNHRCVEPSHLWLGTMDENMADRDAKGRNGTLGEDSPLAKLKAGDVEEIRGRISGGESDKAIARLYGVAPITIWRIRNGQTWNQLRSTRKTT